MAEGGEMEGIEVEVEGPIEKDLEGDGKGRQGELKC